VKKVFIGLSVSIIALVGFLVWRLNPIDMAGPDIVEKYEVQQGKEQEVKGPIVVKDAKNSKAKKANLSEKERGDLQDKKEKAWKDKLTSFFTKELGLEEEQIEEYELLKKGFEEDRLEAFEVYMEKKMEAEGESFRYHIAEEEPYLKELKKDYLRLLEKSISEEGVKRYLKLMDRFNQKWRLDYPQSSDHYRIEF
jgi:hypothetical protein